MGTGLLTLAVITAQVASSFVAQGASRAKPARPDEPARREVTLDELDERLARIERLLTASNPGSLAGIGGTLLSGITSKSSSTRG